MKPSLRMNKQSSVKKLPKAVKMAIRTLPLAGAASTVFFNFTRLEQQLMILIVLVWVQVYFVLELFLAGK
jgi:hypothetical protein